jgi:hypothetical protein
MKTYRTPGGPFKERPFYKDEDIERICSDALTQSGYMPSAPEPIRIDRFVEKHFDVRIIFEDLHPGVLGYTEFGSRGVAAVHIAEPPAAERTKASKRRINSTIAHEGGHGLMHAHLFALGDDLGSLFGADPDVTNTKVLCRDGDPGNSTTAPKRAYDGRWWELQANRAIGALLLPRDLFVRFLDPYLVRRGTFGAPSLVDDRRAEAISAAAETFDVNPAVARIRVEMLFSAQKSAQLTL